MNKKANFQDIAEWLELVFALFLVFIIVLLIYNGFNTGVQNANDESIPTEVKEASDNYNSALPGLMDWLFVGMFIVFIAFSVFSARLIPSSPKFIFIAIFITIILVFVSMVFIENIYDGWSQQETISNRLALMTFFPFFMENLRYFVLVYCFGVAVSILSKEGT